MTRRCVPCTATRTRLVPVAMSTANASPDGTGVTCASIAPSSSPSTSDSPADFTRARPTTRSRGRRCSVAFASRSQVDLARSLEHRASAIGLDEIARAQDMTGRDRETTDANLARTFGRAKRARRELCLASSSSRGARHRAPSSRGARWPRPPRAPQLRRGGIERATTKPVAPRRSTASAPAPCGRAMRSSMAAHFASSRSRSRGVEILLRFANERIERVLRSSARS